MASKIEWTDETWNPVTGCTKVSPGCDHCYAETFAERFRGVPGHHFEDGFDVTLRPERLDIPLRWRKPRRIFVNSMSDLFHDQVPDEYIARVFAVMALAPHHTFQVLTKRHARMRALLSNPTFLNLVPYLAGHDYALVRNKAGKLAPRPGLDSSQLTERMWPLPNVWLGISVENQQWADIRIPALLDTPAVVRFLSCEPLLGPLDLTRWLPLAACPNCGDNETDHYFAPGDFYGRTVGCRSRADGICGCRKLRGEREHNLGDPYLNHGLHWVIVGGESGRGARPMHPDWARSLRDQCQAAGVPFLFKQWGEWRYAIEVDDFAVEQAIKASGQPDPFELTSCYTVGSDGSYSNTEPPREGNATMMRVGKHKAGRVLDGRTWDEYPVGAP